VTSDFDRNSRGNVHSQLHGHGARRQSLFRPLAPSRTLCPSRSTVAAGTAILLRSTPTRLCQRPNLRYKRRLPDYPRHSGGYGIVRPQSVGLAAYFQLSSFAHSTLVAATPCMTAFICRRFVSVGSGSAGNYCRRWRDRNFDLHSDYRESQLQHTGYLLRQRRRGERRYAGALGANGILGVGPEPFDCGSACDPSAGGIHAPAVYYSCGSGGNCSTTFVSCGTLCQDPNA
jgi:hypothetical protein